MCDLCSCSRMGLQLTGRMRSECTRQVSLSSLAQSDDQNLGPGTRVGVLTALVSIDPLKELPSPRREFKCSSSAMPFARFPFAPNFARPISCIKLYCSLAPSISHHLHADSLYYRTRIALASLLYYNGGQAFCSIRHCSRLMAPCMGSHQVHKLKS